MSHRYRLADTLPLPPQPARQGEGELKTEGWLLTSCSPSREDDPVHRRRVPLLAIHAIHVDRREQSAEALSNAPSHAMHASGAAQQAERKSGTAHFVILHRYPTPGLLAAAPLDLV